MADSPGCGGAVEERGQPAAEILPRALGTEGPSISFPSSSSLSSKLTTPTILFFLAEFPGTWQIKQFGSTFRLTSKTQACSFFPLGRCARNNVTQKQNKGPGSYLCYCRFSWLCQHGLHHNYTGSYKIRVQHVSFKTFVSNNAIGFLSILLALFCCLNKAIWLLLLWCWNKSHSFVMEMYLLISPITSTALAAFSSYNSL